MNQADSIFSMTGPPWAGAGNPAAIVVAVTSDSSLIGFKVYLQGVLLDSGGPTRKVGLTTAVEVTIQPSSGPA